MISGRGKGGSLSLTEAEQEQESVEPIDEDSQKTAAKEADLYPGAEKVIRDSWVQKANYDEYLVETTALKGSAPTGEKWSRPDVAVLATKAFPYLPERLFDIITFEIKPSNQVDVVGVFEALAHQQFAHRAYVLFHVDNKDDAQDFAGRLDKDDRILSTANQFGVGVIIAHEITNWETWDELLPATRNTPDPEQANRFIATCFKNRIEQVIKWHK